jgi:hypothetical protein
MQDFETARMFYADFNFIGGLVQDRDAKIAFEESWPSIYADVLENLASV